jgi:hypothetical protein
MKNRLNKPTDPTKKKKITGRLMYGGTTKISNKELPDLPKRKPDVDPVIQFKLDKERDEKIARAKDLEVGGLIYQEWKAKFIARKRTPGQILEKLNELAAELEQAIVGDSKWYVLNEIINPIIARLHEVNVMTAYSQEAIVDCQRCGWGGKALFHKHIWEQGKCEMDCPGENCGTRLTQADDMITMEEGKKIAERARKEKNQ